jgi:hypothetical protein
MRSFVLLIYLLIATLLPGCKSTRLGRIHSGMTRTDVAIELGKPANVMIEEGATYWIYPSSEKEICKIKFVNQRVHTDAMVCDSSDDSRVQARKSAYILPRMNSEEEYQGRLTRFCGRKPLPTPGCRISDQCVNGGWEEVCD